MCAPKRAASLDHAERVSAKHLAEAVPYRTLNRNYWQWRTDPADPAQRSLTNLRETNGSLQRRRHGQSLLLQ